MTKFRLIDLKYFLNLWCKFFLLNVHVALEKLLIKITVKFSLTVILIIIQRFNFASRHWINVLQIASFRQWTRICFFLIDHELIFVIFLLFFRQWSNSEGQFYFGGKSNRTMVAERLRQPEVVRPRSQFRGSRIAGKDEQEHSSRFQVLSSLLI